MGVVIVMIAGIAGAMAVAHLMRGYDQGWIVNGLAGLIGATMALAVLTLAAAHGPTGAPGSLRAAGIAVQALCCLLGGGAVLITVGFLRDLLVK